MVKKIIFSIVSLLVIVIIITGVLFYPAIRSMFHKEIVQVDPNLTLVLGGGGNSGILIGDSAVVVIDTKMMSNSEEVYNIAKRNAGSKPIIVINTHYHSDHVNGNKLFKGSRIYIGSYENTFLQNNIEPENQPTDFVKDSLTIDLGSEKVNLYNLGQAHTTNDLVVYLTNHHIVFSGDLVVNHTNPVLVDKSGAKVSKWIAALDLLLHRWEFCKFVPGHGPVGDKETVAALRQYFIDLTAAANDPSKEKQMTDSYNDWMKLPFMASPQKTVEYIRAHP